LAKIAVDKTPATDTSAGNGSAGPPPARIIARGDGWTVADVVCGSGPDDRPFEEQHTQFAIALVTAGTFQYRSPFGTLVMTPGSLMLGNAGHCFECGHEHATGDRCLSFWFAPDYFERLAADAGMRSRTPSFLAGRVPPVRALSPLLGRACAGLAGRADAAWEEIGVDLATNALQLAAGIIPVDKEVAPSAAARVTRAVRCIEDDLGGALTLRRLARESGLSPYHFLRAFERLTGLTPHQYVRRARLRKAAVLLADAPGRVLDIALECGFGDASNFNRAFRAEFGVSPRRYRRLSLAV
jgi:AraC family transcriptional regulator